MQSLNQNSNNDKISSSLLILAWIESTWKFVNKKE